MDDGEIYLRAALWGLAVWLGATIVKRLRFRSVQTPNGTSHVAPEHIQKPVLPEFHEWHPTSFLAQ